MYLHRTKNGHYTPPCCYFSGELEVVEGIRNNGGGYPQSEIFTHIDYTKNQYSADEYQQKYADSIDGMPIDHYTEKIALDDLSEHFFINKFYLSKIFRETYGTTVNNYLISKRITRAKQLLRFTDMTVDEVGAAVGMGDANYFSRMFRKVEGISPREYRKQW